jgi:hypothetical protein
LIPSGIIQAFGSTKGSITSQSCSISAILVASAFASAFVVVGVVVGVVVVVVVVNNPNIDKLDGANASEYTNMGGIRMKYVYV